MQTIESVSELATEIIVVHRDDENTKIKALLEEIAEKEKVRTLSHTWEGDNASAKNAGLDTANCAWILALEPGEVLSEETRKELQIFLAGKIARNPYALFVQRPEAAGGISPEQQLAVRLLPAGGQFHYVGKIGEQIQSRDHGSFDLDYLPCTILQLPELQSTENKKERAKTDLEIGEEILTEDANNPRICNLFGEALQVFREFERAAQCYKRAIEHSEKGSTEMLEGYYNLLSVLEKIEGGKALRVPLCVEALESYPLDAQLLCAMGGYLQSEGKPDLALRSYQTAYQYGEVHPETWHLVDMAEVSAMCYSLSLQGCDKNDDACVVLEEASQTFPDSYRLKRQLLNLYLKQAKKEKSLTLLEEMPFNKKEREQLKKVVSGVIAISESDWEKGRDYLLESFNAGCRDPICLRWLSMTLVQLQELNEARPVLECWQKLDPTNGELVKMLAVIDAHKKPLQKGNTKVRTQT